MKNTGPKARNLMMSLFCALALLTLVGCTGTLVSDPEAEITLERALESVGKGLKVMEEARGEARSGLVPTQVTVTFNVSASATDSGSIALTVTPAPPVGGGTAVGGSGAASATANAARSNQITMTFQNVLYAPEDTLIRAKTQEELAKLVLFLRSQNFIMGMDLNEFMKTVQEADPSMSEGIMALFRDPELQDT